MSARDPRSYEHETEPMPAREQTLRETAHDLADHALTLATDLEMTVDRVASRLFGHALAIGGANGVPEKTDKPGRNSVRDELFIATLALQRIEAALKDLGVTANRIAQPEPTPLETGARGTGSYPQR